MASSTPPTPHQQAQAQPSPSAASPLTALEQAMGMKARVSDAFDGVIESDTEATPPLGRKAVRYEDSGLFSPSPLPAAPFATAATTEGGGGGDDGDNAEAEEGLAALAGLNGDLLALLGSGGAGGSTALVAQLEVLLGDYETTSYGILVVAY